MSASASGVVSGGSSMVAWEAADAEAVVVESGPRGGAGLSVSVVKESKRVDAGWESTSGRYCEKNWCKRRSGALRGGWDASAVGAAEGVERAEEDDTVLDGEVVVVPGVSSGKGDDVCCCWVSPLAVLASTRVGDFEEALAGGTTLGGFDELKKRPPGGFENREYDLREGWCMGRRNLGNIVCGLSQIQALAQAKANVGGVSTRSECHVTGLAGRVMEGCRRPARRSKVTRFGTQSPFPSIYIPAHFNSPPSARQLPTLSTHPLHPSASLVTPTPPVAMPSPTEETIADIKSATAGFDMIFSNELEKAESIFGNGDSALHLLGSGACAFLRAALSLEVRTRLHDTGC